MGSDESYNAIFKDLRLVVMVYGILLVYSEILANQVR